MARKVNMTDSLLEGNIRATLNEMETYGVHAPEYQDLLTKLERLYELKSKDRQKPVSRDTIWVVIGNLACVLVIVSYEQKHVLSSKAAAFFTRLKSNSSIS